MDAEQQHGTSLYTVKLAKIVMIVAAASVVV